MTKHQEREEVMGKKGENLADYLTNYTTTSAPPPPDKLIPVIPQSLPSPSTPPEGSIFAQHHVLSPFGLESVCAVSVTSKNSLHVFVDRLLPPIEAFQLN